MATPARRAWRPVLATMVIGLMVVFLFVWLFAAALHQPQAHDLPVGVVAPASVVQKVTAALETKAPGAFVVSTYSSADEARTAVRERHVVGAFVVGPPEPTVLVASGASGPTADAVSAAFTAVGEALGHSPRVEDVQPFPASDPRGVVPFFLVLGVTISAFMFQMFSLAHAGLLRLASRAISMTLFAALDGLLAALAVGIVLGFDDSYWLLAGVCGLLALAVTAACAAFSGLFGRAGTGLAAFIVILLANASSGSILGRHFLPQPFRWLSPVLPASSALEAVRSCLYFGGAGLGWPLGALALWVAGSFFVLGCLGLRKRWVRAKIDVPA